ncbi:hypothetical protein G7046_g4908 [Stylonectria norvegica]|nr:hypothetical protein G7046_g4908 [Stylonectria norvegica]
MSAMWNYLRQSASTKSVTYDALYDDERSWDSRKPFCPAPRNYKDYLRFPRLRKAALWLILTDIVIFGILIAAFWPLITLLTRNEELFGPRFSVSPNDAPDAWSRPSERRIPRILHQTTANTTIPEKWVESQQSCINAYSNFEYHLWTDAKAREFIATEYPWFINVWDNYPFPIQRADSIRYFVLHHYGGIYLDMDTLCNETFPIDQIGSDDTVHHALFKSTLPTGVTNDFMISSPRHPAFTATIRKLPLFYSLTRFWGRLLPYGAIMISSGPFMLTLAVKSYMQDLPSLPTPTIQVINQTLLDPYITDLASCTWHQDDAKALMWIGDRPWSWYAIGVVGLTVGLWILNNGLLRIWKSLLPRATSVTDSIKLAKLV